MNKLKVISESTLEPITLEEARLHLRLDADGSPPSHPDDSLVTTLITVARQHAETYLGQAIAQKTFEVAIDELPDGANQTISLEMWPVNAVTSITYIDSDGVQQPFTDYQLDTYAKPAAVYPDERWPAVKRVPNAVIISFIAGYTDNFSPNPYPLPAGVKQAMLLLIGHLYQNRESVTEGQMYEMPQGFTALLTPYRLMMGL